MPHDHEFDRGAYKAAQVGDYLRRIKMEKSFCSEETSESRRDAARVFLNGLQSWLKEGVPNPEELRNRVATTVKTARSSSGQRQNAFPEGAFLNCYIYPGLHEYLLREFGGDVTKASYALLSESWKSLNGKTSGTPARRVRHPFSKALGTPREVIAQWRRRSPLVQSCPDFALRAPHKIVFEAKYFHGGQEEAAASTLADGIYQAFFYRGLPEVPAKGKRPAWDYDYACFLACDATDHGYLLKAWEGLDPAVRRGCWDGANVFVMILWGGVK